MRRLPSDDWRWSLTHRRWRYYRWFSWSMSAIGVLMSGWAIFALLFITAVYRPDLASLAFVSSFGIGGGVISYGAFRVYRWLGRREPPTQN